MQRTAVSGGLVVMWSSGFIGAELGTRHATTDTLLMWRFIVAAALVGGAWLLARRPRLSRRALGGQVVIGLLSQGVYVGSIVGAIALGVPLGTTALIAALQPLLAATLAGRILGERATSRQWVGLVAGLGGVALVVGDDLATASSTPWPAYALPFVGMAGLLAASLVERRLAEPVGLVDALPVHCVTSAAAFAAAALLGGRATPPQAFEFWLAVAWVVLLSTVAAYGLYWSSIRRYGVGHTSALMYLTPAATTLWAFAMFGQPVSMAALSGMAICLAGVVAATVANANQRTASPVQ
ncbi:MAG TPA: DMT family transporter [Euzebyales bacterium]|nr:DMT family transporter [Euzebyales bacterium]